MTLKFNNSHMQIFRQKVIDRYLHPLLMLFIYSLFNFKI